MSLDNLPPMDYLPLFADLRGKACLVVGGGVVALRRVRWLLRAGALPSVQAPEIHPELRSLAAAGRIELLETPFSAQGMARFWLIIAATSDDAVNREVAAAAAQLQRFCNVVDNTRECSVIMPAIVDRSPVTVAISTGGRSPALARWVKALVETAIPGHIGRLARLFETRRPQVREMIPEETARRHFWETAAAQLQGESAGAADSALAAAFDRLLATQGQTAEGVAWLVGAGPGDPELISLRGRRLLSLADVVLYDRLVNPAILEYARRDADFIAVGKQGGGKSTSQAEINRRLVEAVAQGYRVCRLKGGDPMVFGRVVEELEALVAAGQRFEIVPGISAVEACAAYAGIPLTWRGRSRGVLITTGFTADGDATEGLRMDSPMPHTLAIYMGAMQAGPIAARLIADGTPAATPVAIIEHGTWPAQRVRRMDLDGLSRLGAADAPASPALLLIGAVAGPESEAFAWFLNQPDGGAGTSA